MTLATTIAGHASTVFLNADHFAETWTLWPKGNKTNAASVTVIWTPGDPSEEDDNIQRVLTEGLLDVPNTLTVDDADVWFDTNGTRWQTQEDGIGEAQAGLRPITLLRADNRQTTLHGRTFRGRNLETNSHGNAYKQKR